MDGRFSAPEWEYIQTFRRDRLPAPPCDDACRAQQELGQRLFFDARLSGPITVAADGSNGGFGNIGDAGRISCASCHDPKTWFIDRRGDKLQPSSLGTAWTGRNVPTLVDVAYAGAYTWSGKYSTAGAVTELAIQSKAAMNTSKEQLVTSVLENHRAAYDRIFDPDLPSYPPCFETGPMPCNAAFPTASVFANISSALGAYESQLVSGLAPFDRYAMGETEAISEEAKRGLGVFIGRGFCSECHDGPLFSDGGFHNTAVAQEGEHISPIDHGRMDVTKDPRDDGAFRTPGLRGVAKTAPYMHTGQVYTLGEAIEHYRWGGARGGYSGQKDARMVPLELDDQDVVDLEAFLETLTGPPVSASLMVPR